MYIFIPDGTRSKELDIRMEPKSLFIAFKNDLANPMLNDEWTE